jgi:hypothetical protein
MGSKEPLDFEFLFRFLVECHPRESNRDRLSLKRDDVYMKAAPTGENAYLGWNRYGISQLGGVPEVVIQLGSIPFLSPVTRTMKESPVAVSLLAGYGCDFMLHDLVEALAKEGIILASAKTGADM